MGGDEGGKPGVLKWSRRVAKSLIAKLDALASEHVRARAEIERDPHLTSAGKQAKRAEVREAFTKKLAEIEQIPLSNVNQALDAREQVLADRISPPRKPSEKPDPMAHMARELRL